MDERERTLGTDDGGDRRAAPEIEDAEAAFRRILARKLRERGFAGAELEREVERLLARAKGTPPADGSPAPRGP